MLGAVIVVAYLQSVVGRCWFIVKSCLRLLINTIPYRVNYLLVREAFEDAVAANHEKVEIVL